jgi:hypothetical protein
MWKLVFNVANVIFELGIPKKETHKVHRNNAPSKTFKKCFWEKEIEKQKKLQLTWTYENMVKF